MKQVKQTNQADKIILIGFTLATAFMDADNKANAIKQELLLESAHTYAGDKAVYDKLLDSYAQTFLDAGQSKNVVKQRKAEARRVFEAVGKTEVSNDNYATLKAFKGGYHEFIGLARDLANAGNDSDNKASPRITRQPKVTPKQEQDILDKMQSATIIQLSDFVETASEVLNSPRNKEDAVLAEKQQFILLNSIANSMMNNKQYDEVTKKSAKAIFDISNEQIGRISANEQKASKAIEAIPATM